MSQDDGDEPDVLADSDSHSLIARLTVLAGADHTVTPGGRAHVRPLADLQTFTPYKFVPAEIAALKSPPEVTAPPVYVERRADLLALVFQFINLGLSPDGGDNRVALRRLKGQSKQDAFIIVYFPPQSFLEAPLPGEANAPPAQSPLIPCAISGPSWLVFRLPAKLSKVPYTLESLLDWKRFELCVYPTAATDEMPADAKQPDQPPQADLLPTFIEAPARLVLSPHQYAGWANAQYPVTSRSEWSELWHTRLAVRCVNHNARQGASNDSLSEGDADARTVRAIGRLDRPNKPALGATLSDDQRRQIVQLTGMPDDASQMRAPLRVERLMLSSLGAWLSLRGDWEIGDAELKAALTLNSWTHRATMGRDHYVRVSEVGFLYPFGHRAVKVTITQRELADLSSNVLPNVGAYLRQRVYIVVQQAEKTYDILPQRRTMPFKRVVVKTLVTPSLDQGKGPSSNEPFFKLTKGGKDFLFHLVGEDADGQTADFMSPLYFVEGHTAAQPDSMEPLLTTTVSCELHGQQVAYAEGDGQAGGAQTLGRTSFETAQVVFGARTVAGQVPCFYPRLQEADVRLLAVERLAATPPGVKIGYHAAYESSGFASASDGTNGGNPGQVFAELKFPTFAPKPAANFPVEKSGGLATPNMNITGLSLSAGVVSGDLDTFAAGQFVPQNYFDASAKILGGISLSSIIADADPNQPELPAALAQAPKVTTRTLYHDDRPELGVAGTEIKMDWTPAVQSAGSFVARGDTRLTINTTLVSRLDSSSEYSVTGVLDNFSLTLAGIIGIDFEELSFTAGQNKKLDFSAKLGVVLFLGPLAFLNVLAAAIDAVGFDDPPFLDVTAEGVRAGYTLGLPPVAVGVMSLDHVSLTAAINLPFDGRPVRARFDFCERHHPFHLIVYGLGGGGFLGVAVGLDGVEVIEAALEFGGCLALNIGVAAGSVSLMAGIYFKVETQVEMQGETQVEKDVVSLSGYLRAVGEMEVLGLICISVEFYMELGYNFKTKVVSGDAILTVEVEVLFFSKSVNLPLHREFQNSRAFKFADVIDEQPDWVDYCAAFAA